MTIIKNLNQLVRQPYFKLLLWSFVSLGFLSQSANAADSNDSLQLHSQFEGIGMTYALAGNSEIVYNTDAFAMQVCSKNNGAATSSGLLNPDGSSLTLAGDATIQAVYIQWYALTYNTDPDGTGLNNSNPLVNSISLTLPDGSAHTVTGSKFYKETNFDPVNSSTRYYEGYFADITSLVTAMTLNDVDGSYTVNLAGQNDASLPQFRRACAFTEENARAWQMTVIYATPTTITDSRKVYFHDGIQAFLDQTGVITPVTGYEVPSSGSTSGKLSVMTLQGDSAIFGETMTTSDTLFPNMPGDFANSAGITSAKGVDAATGGQFGGWDIDTLTGNFTTGSTSMNLVSGSVGDLILITGAVLEIPSLPTTPPVVKKCFAMTDDVAELYSFDLDSSTAPNKVNMARLFNGEGTAYRATDNALYAFDQSVKMHDEPSDLYKVELDGSSTLITSNFIASRAAGAEFVRYSDGSEIFMVLQDEFDAHIQYFDASNLASKTPLKTLYLTFPDGSKAQVTSLAINPKTGEVLVVDDADAVDDYPDIYSVNMHTGRLTLKVTLSVPGIDAESLAFAEDGFAYIENEGSWTSAPYSHHIYRVNLTTGDITAVEDNLDSVISGDIEGMSCTGSKITTPPPPPPKVYDPKACGVPGFLETFGSGAGRGPIPASSWSNYDYDEGPTDTNNGAVVEDNQYVVLDKSSIPSAGAWWIVDDDHTGDANGRMLMVNADYFAGEFYRQSITGLEVGKEYSFAAHIANAEGDIEVRIPVNVKFSLESGGAEIAFVETGNILQDPGRDELAWAKYELKFTATSTDVDIVLVNNIGGGMGNDLVIDDISISEVCKVCTAFTGEVTEADLPITTQLQTGDKLFLPSKTVATGAGHLEGYTIDASGIPSKIGWDVATLMTSADRKLKLFSSNAAGDSLVLFDALDSTAFDNPSTPVVTIKTNTFNAVLGGISRGNSLDILTQSMDTSLYLYDTVYRTYYNETIASRNKRVLVSSDDGFLYAFDYDTGVLAWAWMPRSLAKELKDPASFQQKHLMAGTLDILDLKDSSGAYATYIVGSYKSGLGHYVLKLDSNGKPSTVVWDVDQSAFVKSPNNGEMEFFKDGTGVVNAAYVLINGSSNSTVIIKSLTDDTTTDLSVNLDIVATSTPFVMQDYGRSNAPAKMTLYIGTSTGDIHAAALLKAGGAIQDGVGVIKGELEGTEVAKMDDNPTDEVIYINSSIAAKDNQYYLSAQTPTRLTIQQYDSSSSSWKKKWTSYAFDGTSGAGSWDWDSGTYTADNSGVPSVSSGFEIVPPTTGIQSLPADATITDKAVIVADTVVLPISVLPASAAECYGKAYYYLYSLTDGNFPKKSFFKIDNTPIETNIALGYGEASQLTISDLRGKDKLLGYGLSDKKVDFSIGLGSPFMIKDPVATGIRGWKEIGR